MLRIHRQRNNKTNTTPIPSLDPGPLDRSVCAVCVSHVAVQSDGAYSVASPNANEPKNAPMRTTINAAAFEIYFSVLFSHLKRWLLFSTWLTPSSDWWHSMVRAREPNIVINRFTMHTPAARIANNYENSHCAKSTWIIGKKKTNKIKLKLNRSWIDANVTFRPRDRVRASDPFSIVFKSWNRIYSHFTCSAKTNAITNRNEMDNGAIGRHVLVHRSPNNKYRIRWPFFSNNDVYPQYMQNPYGIAAFSITIASQFTILLFVFFFACVSAVAGFSASAQFNEDTKHSKVLN